MKLQLIRSAKLRMTVNGRRFIIDPFLAAKGTVRSFAGIAPNPIVELPCSPQEAITGVEMALISHLRVDHMDATQTVAVCQAAPQATIIAVHLESLDHGTVSRADLRAAADSHRTPASRLLIPLDGETVNL